MEPSLIPEIFFSLRVNRLTSLGNEVTILREHKLELLLVIDILATNVQITSIWN